MQGVTHHLLDVASPKKQFTVDHFVKKAGRAFTLIYQSKKIPIVVGGTGLYVDMLLGRMSYAEVPPNFTLRQKLEKKSVSQLLAMLKKKDPRRAGTIEPHHKRRLIRALEIAAALGANPPAGGLPLHERKYEVLWLGINPDEKVLKKKIHTRLLARMRSGMVREAKKLHKEGLSYKRMNELGLEYRYLALYLQGKLTRMQMLAQLERAIVQYAKRQKRWFKHNQDILWVKNNAHALRKAKKFIQN